MITCPELQDFHFTWDACYHSIELLIIGKTLQQGLFGLTRGSIWPENEIMHLCSHLVMLCFICLDAFVVLKIMHLVFMTFWQSLSSWKITCPYNSKVQGQNSSIFEM